MNYRNLRVEDKAKLLCAQSMGANWVAVQWGGKAYGYGQKPKREEICDACCYGSYSEWSAQNGDYEIELGFMPYPLLSYQDKEPLNIALALEQIAAMERSVPVCEYCQRLSRYAGWGYATWFEQTGPDEQYELSVDIKFCPECGRKL